MSSIGCRISCAYIQPIIEKVRGIKNKNGITSVESPFCGSRGGSRRWPFGSTEINCKKMSLAQDCRKSKKMAIETAIYLWGSLNGPRATWTERRSITNGDDSGLKVIQPNESCH